MFILESIFNSTIELCCYTYSTNCWDLSCS